MDPISAGEGLAQVLPAISSGSQGATSAYDSLQAGQIANVGAQTAIANVQATNAANAQEAYLNRTWQRQMEEGRYQRTVTDMKKAGLNPAVIFGAGGGSPGGGHPGAQARFENASGAIVQSAMERARIKQQSSLIASEIQRNGMEAVAKGMEMKKIEPEIRQREAETQSALEQAHEYAERAKSLSLDNEVKERKNVIERKIPWLTGGFDAIGTRLMPAINTGLGLYLGKRLMGGKSYLGGSGRSRTWRERIQDRRDEKEYKRGTISIDKPLEF